MIILDNPYVSDELKEYLRKSGIPVLKNDYAAGLSDEKLNLTDEAEFKKLLISNPNLLAVSEHSLGWIYKNCPDKDKIRNIGLMKDKYRLREAMKALYPDFFFKEVSVSELAGMDFSTLRFPVVLKPSVGFFSEGVYTIFDGNDWKNALADISQKMQKWAKDYPEDVVGKGRFIIEEYIKGEEYALDAYYGDDGKAVVLNIFKHDFGSASDVSDRLYYTSKKIVTGKLGDFTEFLDASNAFFKAKNFPVHVELRVSGGRIIPVEFNPLRFAGWCTTDLAYFSYGFKTYDYFFSGKKPDWNALLAGKDEKIYTLILLNKPQNVSGAAKFDYEALQKKFKKVLKLRKTENAASPIFGFLFTETPEKNRSELDYIVKTDLTEFIS